MRLSIFSMNMTILNMLENQLTSHIQIEFLVKKNRNLISSKNW